MVFGNSDASLSCLTDYVCKPTGFGTLIMLPKHLALHLDTGTHVLLLKATSTISIFLYIHKVLLKHLESVIAKSYSNSQFYHHLTVVPLDYLCIDHSDFN